MGYKLDKQISGGQIDVPAAYGRIERIEYQKDVAATIKIDWWKDRQSADERIQTIAEDSITITAEELATSESLKTALDTIMSELYTFGKTKPGLELAEDVM